jgi:peptide subunit release factor 1 (eRF1)
MTALQETLDRLAAFEPVGLPVVSLYLNLQPNEVGRDAYDVFVRNELPARARTWVESSAERDSLEQDLERIDRYLANEVRPSANGLAIFACSGADDFFEAVQLDAPIEEHRLYLHNQPHLYHLARLNDAFPPYAAVVLDSKTARIYVFALGERVNEATIENEKPKQHKKGGWSQARYQRHTGNMQLQHVKEVVEALDRIVREDRVDRIVLAGDEVILPLVREELPKHLSDKVIDTLSLDIRTPEHEVLQATLESLRQQDEKEDRDKVQQLMDAYRGGGLGVVGARATLDALMLGQVDELLIGPALEREEDGEAVSDELVTSARATGAAVTFIEDASLLDEVGGVGALLRFKIR